MTLKEGDGEGWFVRGSVGGPRFFTFWREDAVRDALVQAGWEIDEVRHGEAEPAGRPPEAWLAVFATRE
jgi:hypothetical protein